MRVWTYEEAKNKVLVDTDLQEQEGDSEFVTPDELAGYFNEAIDDAEAEIHKLHEDYFLKRGSITLVDGTADYDLPTDIYANKIRAVMYINGSTIYEVRRVTNDNKFLRAELANINAGSEDYRYLIVNDDVATGYQMRLYPTAYESGAYIKLWYLRNATRVPLTTEYQTALSFSTSDVDTSTDVITLSDTSDYATGDAVKFTSTGTLPGGLTAGTVYYLIVASSTTIKVATTEEYADAGTAVDLTSTGSGTHSFTVEVTEARQNEYQLDIPEFTSFILQFVKCRLLGKIGDPRIDGEIAVLQHQRKMMVDTLTQMVPDDHDEIPADYSHYEEHL